jgi:redox-sensitive bicupin YhaK (pirin superfamily)
MIEKRSYDSLGKFQFDWLNARHHFSFGEYYDASRMGWGALRVWNDDEIRAGGGFPTHPHRDMEIITYVREGAISHRDSVGNEGRTEAGDVQVMSAGTGVRHSEFNHEDEQTTIFQIWIMPDQAGGEPRWDASEFPKGDRAGELVTLASGKPEEDGGLLIRADAKILGATLKAGESVEYKPQAGRHLYLVPAAGKVEVNGLALNARDGAAIKDEDIIRITASEEAEIVMVDSR